MEHVPLSDEVERIATAIVDSAYHVHRALGPGLLESVYEVCLCYELKKRGFVPERQVSVPIVYDRVRFEEAYCIDVLVNNCVICEIKSVEDLHPVHEAQLLTYLRLTKHRLGFLINFNVPLIKDGIQRLIN